MAQLVAHLLCKQGVRGSSPLGSTAGQRPFPLVGRASFASVPQRSTAVHETSTVTDHRAGGAEFHDAASLPAVRVLHGAQSVTAVVPNHQTGQMTSLLTAWSVAGLFSKTYNWIASVIALFTVTALLLGGGQRPSGVVRRLFGIASVSPPLEIDLWSSWLANRAELVASIALVAGVVALLWSGALLMSDPNSFDSVRGPATAWLALALSIEATGGPGRFTLLVGTVALVIAALCADVLRNRIDSVARQGMPSVTKTVGLVAAGVVLVLVWAPMGLAHAMGGSTRRANRAPSSQEAAMES